MKMVYKKFELSEEIPVRNVLKNKKLIKYFNRETAAGIFCLSELLSKNKIDSDTPFFYETGFIEYEDFGLNKIVETCVEEGKFSQKAFVEKGMSSISPLTQFKILLNMPLCFFSIENNFTGDNAVIYSSAMGLFTHAHLAGTEGNILLGSGKVNADGSIESGFMLIKSEELNLISGDFENKEGIEIFRLLNVGELNA